MLGPYRSVGLRKIFKNCPHWGRFQHPAAVKSKLYR
jgi:hypothetical protein